MLRSEKYSIDIISRHPQFLNKNLKKYNVDDIETVGAWGDEPFEIKFKNNTSNKIQVKISIDGTDVLTGEPASTDLRNGMWVVCGYGTLVLRAWPETNMGGASFIFTSADNSVALHTHGDLRHRGIIAAAIYEENYVEPIRINHNYINNIFDYEFSSPIGGVVEGVGGGGEYSSFNEYLGDSRLSLDSSRSDNDFSICHNSANTKSKENLKSLVSVGAGDYVNQKITYVSGLIEPKLAETVKVRYLWWDQLKEKLKDQNHTDAHPSGFPGDKEHKVMDLKSTPRIKSQKQKIKRFAQESAFSRF